MTLRAPHLSGKRPLGRQAPQPIPNLLVATLLVAFVPVIFPIPQAQAIQQPVQTGMPLVIMEDAGEKPFLQTEWPNPKLDIKVQTPFQVGSSLTLIEDAGEKPFLQSEWINPPPRVVQTPFQHQKHAALESVALSPTPVSFPNPAFPIAQQPFQLQRALVLFEPCDFSVFAFLGPVPTDVLRAIVETDDVSSTITENTDIRKVISTDATDVSKDIVETDDVSGEIC